MTAPEFFRFLIVVRIAVGLLVRITGLVPWDHNRLSDSLNPFAVLLIELPLVVVAIAITVGLWQFRSWARIAYVVVSVASVLVAIFLPPRTSFD